MQGKQGHQEEIIPQLPSYYRRISVGRTAHKHIGPCIAVIKGESLGAGA